MRRDGRNAPLSLQHVGPAEKKHRRSSKSNRRALPHHVPAAFKPAAVSITSSLSLPSPSCGLQPLPTLSRFAIPLLSPPSTSYSTPPSFATPTAMKLASAALLLLAPLTVATPSPSFLDVQSPIKAKDQGPPVDGDNPLSYCGDPSSYILQIDTVNLQPNPPEA